MENKENIGLQKIEFLVGKSFFVPNYQRAYKWKPKDVEHLIDDIANSKDGTDYCLQPIVVAKKENGSYILVDGQQRLTTILLILRWAKKHGLDMDFDYTIKYETRDASNDFLEKLHFEQDVETCDVHYFREAIKQIEQMQDKLQLFLEKLKKNVKIIWYEIDENEGIAHFERLNHAKIGLTNAELVKAYLLINCDENSKSRMACQWDEIEYQLQNDAFFDFITQKNSIYKLGANRIELLLDLYVGTTPKDKEKDEHHTFNQIATNGKTIPEVWSDLQKIYNRLLCWYNDNFIYNIVGYLVETKKCNLQEIWENCKNKSIVETHDFVLGKLQKTLPSSEEIENLQYKDANTFNVLFLFNILSLMSVNDNNDKKEYVFNDKFHFELFKAENWDKEHVHATKSETLQSKIEWINWLKGINWTLLKDKFSNTDYKAWIEQAQKIKTAEDYRSVKEDKHEIFKDLTKEKFIEIYDAIVKELEGEDEEFEAKQNSIGNLVLLNADINRSNAYKVAPFSTKRQIIMDRVKAGKFVPFGTQNLFMKVYTPTPGNFFRWEKTEVYGGNEKSDKDYYIEAIVETINRIRE